MIRKQSVKKIIYEYVMIGMGSIIMSLGLVIFLAPAKIAPGGVSGLAIVLYHSFNLPMGIMMLIFNIPLFIMGIKILGKKFGSRTLYAFILLSVATDLFNKFLPAQSSVTEPLLASIFGGIILGAGLGLVFRFKGTTGGSDIVGQIINKYTDLSIGTSIMLVDFFIISIAGLAFRDINLALYGFIGLYFSSRVIDLIIDGFDYARSFYIVSEKKDEIMDAIIKEMGRGGTLLDGKGFYTRKKRDLLFTVCTRKEVGGLKELVLNIDPDAFIIVNNVHEVIGEGFRRRSK